MPSIPPVAKRASYYNSLSLFQKGYIESNWLLDDQRVSYLYHGRLSAINFLKKLYPLDKMPSTDDRFENAEGDIWQHTVNNDDWESDWVFSDDRFKLLKVGA